MNNLHLTSSRRQFLKRAILVSGAALAAGVGGYSLHSNIIEITQHHLAGALIEGRSLKIAVVSDFHAPRSFVTADDLSKAVNGAECHALFILGDTIDDSSNLRLVTGLFKNIRVRGPKLAVLGNWEHWSGVDLAALSKAYDDAGVRLLVNETLMFTPEGSRITVVGLDDLIAGRPNFELVRGPKALQIVLAHCPASFDHVNSLAGGPTLTLSGHTHGGQIAPLGFALWLPQGSGHYVRGWYHAGKHQLFVTRGLGNSIVPFRIGSRPELAIIQLS
jgi:hypothetical protein